MQRQGLSVVVEDLINLSALALGPQLVRAPDDHARRRVVIAPLPSKPRVGIFFVVRLEMAPQKKSARMPVNTWKACKPMSV